MRAPPTWATVAEMYQRGRLDGERRVARLFVVLLALGLLTVTLAGCCSRRPRPACPNLGPEVYNRVDACDPRTPQQRGSCCGTGLPPCESARPAKRPAGAEARALWDGAKVSPAHKRGLDLRFKDPWWWMPPPNPGGGNPCPGGT